MTLSADAREGLEAYGWPGNVRELKNAVTVAHALSEGGPLDIAAHVGMLGASRSSGVDPGTVRNYHDAKQDALEAFERQYFQGLVAETSGNVAEISRRAGLQRTHVRRYLQRHGLRPRPVK